MPVKETAVKEAYCDVCDEKGALSCAVCGGVFCVDHCISIEFRRGSWIVNRRICGKCLKKPADTGVRDIIFGDDPEGFRGVSSVARLRGFVAMQTDKTP